MPDSNGLTEVRRMFNETLDLTRTLLTTVTELTTRTKMIEERVQLQEKILVHGEPGRESIMVTLRLLAERLQNEADERASDQRARREDAKDSSSNRMALVVAVVSGIFSIICAGIALMK